MVRGLLYEPRPLPSLLGGHPDIFVRTLGAFGGTLSISNGTLSTSLHMIGDYTQSSFTLSADKNGNTLIG